MRNPDGEGYLYTDRDVTLRRERIKERGEEKGMRTVRSRRHRFIDLRRIMIGDYIVLLASLFTLISLFMPWFMTTVPGSHDQWAFTYSEVASVVVIVFFLASLFLVIYPAVSAEAGLPPLPFATPLIFLTMGSVLLLLFMYELGRYDCIQCQVGGVGRGFGIWVGLIASLIYLMGAIVRWGSRPVRQS